MYCHKCGLNIGPGKNFCPACGASQQQEFQPAEAEQYTQMPEQYAMPPEQYVMPPPNQTKKPKKWIWITVASAAAVILIACAVYFIFFQNVSHLLTVGRALGNMNEEANERINNSPFKVFSMLPEIMEDGTITANVEYSHDLLDNFFGSDIGANIQISSNTKTREFSLNMKETYSGGFNDLDFYMNKERLALRLGLLDNNFYGIRYETFRNDIRVFGKLLWLDDEFMDDLADIVDLINQVMNLEEPDELYEVYPEVMTNFAKNIKTTSSRISIESAGKNVKCSAIEILINKDNIISLMNDIIEIYETDETIKAQYAILDNPLFSGFTGNSGGDYHKEFLKSLKDSVKSIEKEYEGDILLTFFVDNSDRLLKVSFDIDAQYDGEAVVYSASVLFGNSIEDDWTFLLSSDNELPEFELIWSYQKQSGNHTNKMEITVDSVNAELSSEWDENNGRFILAYDDGRLTEANITGIFISDDNEFQLKLDNLLPGLSGNKLIIDLTAAQGADIKNIDYINIDKWGQTLINSITRLLLGLIF